MASSTDERNNIVVEQFDLEYRSPTTSRRFGREDVVVNALFDRNREIVDLQFLGSVGGAPMTYGEDYDFAVGTLPGTQFYDPALTDRGSKMVLGTATRALSWNAPVISTTPLPFMPPEADRLLFENALVRAYAARSSIAGSRCTSTGLLVFKVDEAYEIGPDEKYLALVRSEVVPRLVAECPPAPQGQILLLENYVENYHLFRDAVFEHGQVTEDYARQRPDPLNIVTVDEKNGEVVLHGCFSEQIPRSIRALKLQRQLGLGVPFGSC
jgi:hypothetical protein